MEVLNISSKKELYINEEIRGKELRVIDADGSQLGILSSQQALALAEEKNLDLVMISPQAKPPVCKIMDYGKYRFEQARREKERRKNQKVVDIKEVKKPDSDAQLVAENIAEQLERRISFRRAMKSCMGRAMKAGAKGIKTSVSGRLGGADMARTEFYSEGNIPLQTLRADIDYGFAEADTTYGKIGVKAWVYHGEVLPTKGNKKKEKEGSDKNVNA